MENFNVLLKRNWESQFRNRSNRQLITLLSRSEVQIDIISINDRFNSNFGILNREGGRVSVQGVESLWGDCRFIPADWGS